MPAAPLTAEQQSAITTRDVSVALSAGAGCGKTFVLTERFLSHLDAAAGERPKAGTTELRQLIAITFTDAAAREMRARIRAKCYERLKTARDEAEQAHWLRLLREIDAARISTIHAFCASLLRTHATEAGVDPTFGVLDQGDADVLQYNAIDDVLREQLEKLDSETLDLAAAYGLGRLKQQIAALLNQRHKPHFDTWLNSPPEELVERWRDWHDREALPNALREIAAQAPIGEMLQLLKPISPKKTAFCDARASLLELLPKICDAALKEEDLKTIRDLARVQQICSSKDWPSAEGYNRYRDVCVELRKLIDQQAPKRFNAQIALQAAELGLALLRLTQKVVTKYASQKAAFGQLDFDDLLSGAYALLTNPQNAAICSRLSSDLRLLLVDEFQDTDELQADLVKALCGAGFETGRLFFVGDFKQSIYRFRGAAPEVFQKLRQQVAERGRLPLNVNFRSQPGILHFVNALFCRAFADFEPLRASREQLTTEPSVEFLWTITPNKNNHRKGEAENARREEARALARRLRSLVDPQSKEKLIVDKAASEPRAVQPRDIAILFRALSDVHLYEEALREYGLDYYLVGGHAFYAQQEIYDVLNLLRAVASTADDLSLAGVLRSPFFSLHDETLFWLVDSAGTLNGGLFADRLPPQVSPEEQSKVIDAADTIRTLRALKDRVPIATLLGEALDRTGYDAVLLSEFLGERKLANLHKLLERARAADAGVTDLDGFITQLAQFIAHEPKEALAATLPEEANVIRLMTVHHAKGLEFPLVVVPDLDRPPRATAPCAALHRDLGPLVPSPYDDDNKDAATGMTLYAALDRAQELEERKRLLYVACTRAADYLILSSSLADFEKPYSDWMKLLATRFNLQTGECIGDLPAEYEAPCIRTGCDDASNFKPIGKSRGTDLLKLLDEAHQIAAEGRAIVPREIEPIPVDRAARRQFSFSRLTGELIRPNGRPVTHPSTVDGDPTVIAADFLSFGSLVHEVLARIDFAGARDHADWCEHLASQHVLLGAKDVAAARSLVERFIASRRARQLAGAAALHREVEFLLAWPPKGVARVERKRVPSGYTDGHLLHGYIDCLYQDTEGRWHVLDYKTNNIKDSDSAAVAQRYEMQMYVYSIAAERVLGEPPVELAIHFLRPGIEHVFPWNDAARRRAIDLVSQAIAATTQETSRKLAETQSI